MRRHPFVEVIMITIALTAVGTVVVLNVPWLPEQASSQSRPMDTLWDVLAVASVFVFALVMAILVVSVMRFRRRHGDLSDGDPIHGNTRLEIVWTAIPAVIVTGAAIYSGVVLANIEDPKPNTQTVNVTGEQFAWSFGFPAEGVRRTGELHLVKDTNYYFNIRAKDVLHSFWVPEFRLKKDAVPGMTTHIRIKPVRTGTYTLMCAELCGLGHPTMRARVIVQDQPSFDRWIEQVKATQPPAPPGGGGAGQAAGAAIE